MSAILSAGLVRPSDHETFFDLVGVGALEADPVSGALLRVNRKFSELMGYPVESLLTLTLRDLLHPDEVGYIWNGWLQWVQQSAPEHAFETRCVRQDGTTVWVQITASILRNGNGELVRTLAVVRDVSDRRHAVEELERARAELAHRVQHQTAELRAAKLQLETLIAASPLSIIALDRDLRVTTWNRAAEQLFGWSEAEVLGQPLPNLSKDAREFSLGALRAGHSAEPLACFETRCRRRDGGFVDVNVWRAPLAGSGGNRGCVAIIMDVTERKRLERALLEASEHEQRRLGQDLHDHLCQHLLGIACSLKAMATTARTEGSERASDIDRAAHMVNSAVQEARDIARGLHPVQLDSAGLMSALRELAHRVSSTVPCELDCPRPVLVNDSEAAMHIYRIAQEAVTNAVKHAQASFVTLRLRETKDEVQLRVSDNGIGASNLPPSGGGMGLQIMKYRAHAIGGRLMLESQPSGGTSVTCTLPKHK